MIDGGEVQVCVSVRLCFGLRKRHCECRNLKHKTGNLTHKKSSHAKKCVCVREREREGDSVCEEEREIVCQHCACHATKCFELQ